MASAPVDSFWRNWIVGTGASIAAFGLMSVLNPGLHASLAFNLVGYGTMEFPSDFAEGPRFYSEWISGILGAALMALGTTWALIGYGPFARGEQYARDLLTYPIAAWFFADSLYSIRSGFPQNVIGNVALAAMFAIPLYFTRNSPRKH
jgi:hypothetical protein